MAEELLDEAQELYETEGEKVKLFFRRSLPGRKLGASSQDHLQGRGDGAGDEQTLRPNHQEEHRSEGALGVLRQARAERELDQGLQGAHEGGSSELPSVHLQPL